MARIVTPLTNTQVKQDKPKYKLYKLADDCSVLDANNYLRRLNQNEIVKMNVCFLESNRYC